MTLVLSLATPRFALQVSDRRLTKTLSSGTSYVCDDDANKLTLFQNRLVFGYTGIAEIGLQRTDVWLANTLAMVSTSPLPEVLAHLRDRATELFRQLPGLAKDKRHAFVGVGWMSKDGETLQPVICRVSNYHDGQKELSQAKEAFSFAHQQYDTPPYWGWLETGARLKPQEISRLSRSISRCARKGTSPRPLLRHIVDLIRTVASRDPKVGKSLLAVCIPRNAAYSDSTLVRTSMPFGVIFWEGQAPLSRPDACIDSLYIPADKYEGIGYVCNVVAKGLVLADIQWRPT